MANETETGKYGHSVQRNGRWMTARGIAPWADLRAMLLEHYPDARVRVVRSFDHGAPGVYDGLARDMPEAEPALPTPLSPAPSPRADAGAPALCSSGQAPRHQLAGIPPAEPARETRCEPF